MQRINYRDLPNCFMVSNDLVDVIVTTDIGPRILSYSFKKSLNILEDSTDLVIQTEEGKWKAIGGHRLSVAPESLSRSYSLESIPIETRIVDPLAIDLVQPTDHRVGIQKEIGVRLSPSSSEVTLVHRITNRSIWAINLAPWCLTIVREGGTAIVPQEPHRLPCDNPLPARTLTLWHFTDLTDPRFTIGKRYFTITGDAYRLEPQKIGFMNKQGWAGYLFEKTLFVKRFPYHGGAAYPDYGANNEIYTSANYIEIETLGPLQHLEPGEVAEHIEKWYLFDDINVGQTEDTMHTAIKARIDETK